MDKISPFDVMIDKVKEEKGAIENFEEIFGNTLFAETINILYRNEVRIKKEIEAIANSIANNILAPEYGWDDSYPSTIMNELVELVSRNFYDIIKNALEIHLNDYHIGDKKKLNEIVESSKTSRLPISTLLFIPSSVLTKVA